jgi:hypothetical protein
MRRRDWEGVGLSRSQFWETLMDIEPPLERPLSEKPYAVFLCYPSPVRLDAAAIWRWVKQRLPDTDVRGGEGPDEPICFFHKGYTTLFAEGKRIPTQTVLLPGDAAPPRESWAADLQQTWDWPGAEAAACGCTAQVMVTDMLSAGIDRKTRLWLFTDVLWAVVKETRPAAIHWLGAGKLVDPAVFIRAAEANDRDTLFGCAFNFRAFNIAERETGEMVMDTRGLAELGLPDVQMHFNAHRLEPQEVVPCLAAIGTYLFEKGDVIGDGHTVQGHVPSEKWTCRHERSIVGPEREVLDINPGVPLAARTGRKS